MSDNDMFRPPIVRNAAAVLDRALLSKTVSLAAARVADRKLISRMRAILEKNKELLQADKISTVAPDPDKELARLGGRCLLLKNTVQADDKNTWGPALQDAVKKNELSVIPYKLKLSYSYWTYLDIMQAVLPEDAQGEIPVGFAIVGHIAHLNLRDQYLQYKYLIAQVLMDKNPTVRTVINKIDNVGDESQFRTFSYEVLAGPDDMNVVLREENVTFKFDYSKVYWNSRLQSEHTRLVNLFKPGEVVCDMMAGVGPFAVPAGKKGVFVWANDLNPESYESMKVNIALNKVDRYVRSYCEDGATFSHTTAQELLNLHATSQNILLPIPKSHRAKSTDTQPVGPPAKEIIIPQTISHFVMNLPASAIDFLPSFRGLYAGQEKLFFPHTETKLPMVHVHCFSTKSADNVKEGHEIAGRCTDMLGTPMTCVTGKKPHDLENNELMIFDVRDVAPQKRMFCATFRIPSVVAFGERGFEGREHITSH